MLYYLQIVLEGLLADLAVGGDWGGPHLCNRIPYHAIVGFVGIGFLSEMFQYFIVFLLKSSLSLPTGYFFVGGEKRPHLRTLAVTELGQELGGADFVIALGLLIIGLAEAIVEDAEIDPEIEFGFGILIGGPQ